MRAHNNRVVWKMRFFDMFHPGRQHFSAQKENSLARMSWTELAQQNERRSHYSHAAKVKNKNGTIQAAFVAACPLSLAHRTYAARHHKPCEAKSREGLEWKNGLMVMFWANGSRTLF
jgi:hypothetical protein